MTRAAVIACEPWQASKANEIREHPESCAIYLLVDEEGAALIAQGILPSYVVDQAQKACEWCAVDARDDVKRIARERQKRLPKVKLNEAV